MLFNQVGLFCLIGFFFLVKWRFRHWFLLNLGKSCFDFRGLQKTACPDLLSAVCCQSLLLQDGALSVGINPKSKFPQVTDISTSAEHLWEPTLHNVLVPLVTQLGFIAELVLNNTWQNHRSSGHRPFLPASTGSGPCCFCSWDMKVWNKTRFSVGGLWKK